jgi:hypothetical protein
MRIILLRIKLDAKENLMRIRVIVGEKERVIIN